MNNKKIVIIGPESTGKSTLCKELADHYKTLWVPEFAREYLLNYGKEYNFTDLNIIAQGQIHSENEHTAILTNDLPLFIDTDLYVIKVWSEFVFNSCNNNILNIIATRKYDLYLLCNTDLPWESDQLREYPDLTTREKLFHFYKDAMVNQYVPWKIISGDYNERLNSAIEEINKII